MAVVLLLLRKRGQVRGVLLRVNDIESLPSEAVTGQAITLAVLAGSVDVEDMVAVLEDLDLAAGAVDVALAGFAGVLVLAGRGGREGVVDGVAGCRVEDDASASLAVGPMDVDDSTHPGGCWRVCRRGCVSEC